MFSEHVNKKVHWVGDIIVIIMVSVIVIMVVMAVMVVVVIVVIVTTTTIIIVKTVYINCNWVVYLSQYSYEANSGEYKASVTIVWNRNHHVDTIDVVLYKCDILGSHREHPDCSLCVTRNVKYQCTWCANTCSFSESCLHTPVSECPKPRIDMVSWMYRTARLWSLL